MLRGNWRIFRPFYDKTNIRHSYIVLLPQVPDDTASTNPVLQMESNPRFNSITADNCVNAIGKLVIDYECNLARMTDKIKVADSNVKPIQSTFSSIFLPLQALAAPLDYAWSVIKILYLVRHSEEIMKAYKNLHTRVQKARVQRFLSLPIYHTVRELNADKKQLDEVQQRVINKYVLEAKLKGIELSHSEQEHFSNILGKISNEKEIMRKKVDEATNRFFHIIDDKEVVKHFPSSLLRQMAIDPTNPNRGPWRLTLRPDIYAQFMAHCPDRDLRRNAWLANVTRASSHSDTALRTSIHMEEIRYQRKDEAKLLRFDSYAQMSMQTKMAGSLNNVLSMIATLHKWSKPVLGQDLTKLQEFAVSKGFEGRIQLWDLAYWRNLQQKELFGIDENELRFYFPLPKVLQGLFETCKTLFGITIKEATGSVETWDEHVTYYDVFDTKNKTHLGSFYLDPYLRPQTKLPLKSWIECSFASGSSKPVSYIILNVFPPMHGRPALLSLNEANLLFQKFGHCLQHTLNTVKYDEVRGLTNIEWDAVDICPHVMSNLLYDQSTLQLISSHCESGLSLPPTIITDIQRARNHMISFDITSNLYLSALDLKLYSSPDFWMDIMRQEWSIYFPFSLDKRDSHPCSFTSIFCDEYPAAYYSSLWSRMIAADVFSAFKEADGATNPVEIGARFRDTFLSLGGGCHPSEVFRRFRGRDPSPDALLRSCNFKD